MHRLLICLMAAGLATAAPALAADRHPGGGHPGAAHPAARMQAHRPAAAHFATRRPAMAHRSFRTSGHRTVYSGGHARVTTHRAAHHAVRHAAHHAVATRHASARFAKVRRAVHARHRFHAGVYHRPRGWFSRHWRLGQRLPRAWFVRDYWLTDWAIYGLWAPIDGLVWVRVGPDAMLIDPVTGEIVSVEYGLFW